MATVESVVRGPADVGGAYFMPGGDT